MNLDVVHGSLPLLLGRKFLQKVDAVEDFRAGELWVKPAGMEQHVKWGKVGGQGLLEVPLTRNPNTMAVQLLTAGKDEKGKSSGVAHSDASGDTSDGESDDTEGVDLRDVEWGFENDDENDADILTDGDGVITKQQVSTENGLCKKDHSGNGDDEGEWQQVTGKKAMGKSRMKAKPDGGISLKNAFED